MEYVAAGDIDVENTHMLSTGGMLTHVRDSAADTFVVATETGMLHPLEAENPGKTFVPANRAAVCQFMKMITLPKLRDALATGERYVVKVARAVAERARVPSGGWSRSTRPGLSRGRGCSSRPALRSPVLGLAGPGAALSRLSGSEPDCRSFPSPIVGVGVTGRDRRRRRLSRRSAPLLSSSSATDPERLAGVVLFRVAVTGPNGPAD